MNNHGVLISIWFPSMPENPIMASVPNYRCLDTALRSVKCGAGKVELAVQLVDGDPANMVVWTSVNKVRPEGVKETEQ